MRLPLLALAFLSGCGPPSWLPRIENAPHQYRADCLTFNSEVELNIDALVYDVELCRWALTSASVVPADRFCPSFSRVPLRVAAAPYFATPTPGSYTHGWTNGFTVYLGRTLWSLPHELIHVYDERRWRFDTADHDPWPPEYLQAERLFQAAKLDP